MSGRLAEAARQLCDTAEAAEWRGPDAYDGLWFGWPAPLRGGRRRRQALIQLHARSPVDFRRAYRREHPRLAKALGIFGATRVRLGDRAGALAPLDLLHDDRSSGTPGWGYPFDTQTRWSFYAANSPNVVVTTYGALGLQDAADAFGVARYADRAAAAAAWAQEALYLPDLGFYAYHAGSRSFIHNASLLGARLVARLLGGDGGARDAVTTAVERTVAAQWPDGSWPYGEGPGLGFIDSFHTGYVLDCLAELDDLDPRVPDAVRRGTAYWCDRFFGPRGEARLWPDRPFPEDAHAAGTALKTLASLCRRGYADRDLLERVADRAAGAMLRDGHAIYRRYRWGTTRVQYLRWADAHLALGLASAAQVLEAGGPAQDRPAHLRSLL